MNDKLVWVGISNMKGGNVAYQSSHSWKTGSAMKASMNQLAWNTPYDESTISIYRTIGLLCIF